MTYTKTRKSFRPVRIVLSSTGSTSAVAEFSLFFSMLGLGSSWVLATVRVSVLERRAAAPGSFSGMRGVTALLLLAVGAVEVSIW